MVDFCEEKNQLLCLEIQIRTSNYNVFRKNVQNVVQKMKRFTLFSHVTFPFQFVFSSRYFFDYV